MHGPPGPVSHSCAALSHFFGPVSLRARTTTRNLHPFQCFPSFFVHYNRTVTFPLILVSPTVGQSIWAKLSCSIISTHCATSTRL